MKKTQIAIDLDCNESEHCNATINTGSIELETVVGVLDKILYELKQQIKKGDENHEYLRKSSGN